MIGLKQMDKLLDELDLQPILNDKVRRVKWLYNNSNKMTMVYEEKLVRLMVHRLTERIKQLENDSHIQNTEKEIPGNQCR